MLRALFCGMNSIRIFPWYTVISIYICVLPMKAHKYPLLLLLQCLSQSVCSTHNIPTDYKYILNKSLVLTSALKSGARNSNRQRKKFVYIKKYQMTKRIFRTCVLNVNLYLLHQKCNNLHFGTI